LLNSKDRRTPRENGHPDPDVPYQLLDRLTKTVIEGALEGEVDDYLGYDRHDPEVRDGGSSRNGHSSTRRRGTECR
jgi:transposase-like protein